MDSQLVKRLQDEYRKRHPTVTFGEVLGEGAFSMTFAASIGRIPCAVKFSKRTSLEDPAVDRERRTLWDSMCQINGHPHVASLQAFEEIDDYLATQWERGEKNLAIRLKECRDRGWPGIPRAELLPYLQQAAGAICYFNGLGLRHRDIKPENLLLFRTQVKVIDFGFARKTESWSVANSQLGTVEYAPLEAWDGSQPPACIDIFCLAGTFIRLATGEFPFGRSDVADARKRRGEFHRDDLLPHEIAALEIALHPDARERKFATALDFVEALRPPASSGVAGRGLAESSPAGEPPSLRASFSELWRAFRNVLRALEGPPAPPFESAEDRPSVTASEPGATPSLSREIRATMDEHAARDRETTRRQSELKAGLERLLAKQLATKQYVWAGGTLAALLRLAPTYQEFLRLDRFLNEIAPETGVARRCDTTGQCYSLILPGEFRMGAPLHYGRESEQPVHPVRHTQPFYMSCHPVTVSQFACCAAELPRTSAAWKIPGFIQEADHPVVNVSFDDAQVFCEFKTTLTGLKHQLPTEAQWEYACRAGLPESLERGLDTQTLARLGHFNATSTTAVGQFAPNANGLYDLLGNCHEWCADFYSEVYYSQSPVDDPPGPQPGLFEMLQLGAKRDLRVARGGCYDQLALPTMRAAFPSHLPNPRVGFRVICPVTLE